MDPDQADAARPRLAVIDAKRGEAFAALYDAAGDELWPAWVGPPEELAERVAELPLAPLAVGDGSVRFRDQLEAAGAVRSGGRRSGAPAACAAPLPASADGIADERDIEPNYLRRPDAELWRERDHRPKNG